MASSVDPAVEYGARTDREAELAAERERLRAEVEELETRLAAAERERDAAREWAAFLEDELERSRERVAELEDRGLLDHLRGLF